MSTNKPLDDSSQEPVYHRKQTNTKIPDLKRKRELTLKEIGAILKKKRRDANLTQTTAAEKIGISDKTLKNIESGDEKTRFEHLKWACQAFGLELSQEVRYFLVDKKTPSRNS